MKLEQKNALSAVFVIAVLFLLVGCSPTYKGDGKFSDSGFWSYPRFVVEFDPLTAMKLSNRFEIQAIPKADYTLMLYWENDDRREILAELGVDATIMIQDETGTIVCEVRQSLSEFHLIIGAGRQAFWHEDCGRLRLNRRQSYSVSIALDTAPKEDFVIVPRLEGGGNELP